MKPELSPAAATITMAEFAMHLCGGYPLRAVGMSISGALQIMRSDGVDTASALQWLRSMLDNLNIIEVALPSLKVPQ